MAEEFVRKEHFDEFARRMDERFDHANELAGQRHDSINQRLAGAEKARDRMDARFLLRGVLVSQPSCLSTGMS